MQTDLFSQHDANWFCCLAGYDGEIPVNGICIDESGRCDDNGFCRFPNGSYAKADLIKLVKESAQDFIYLLANYW